MTKAILKTITIFAIFISVMSAAANKKELEAIFVYKFFQFLTYTAEKKSTIDFRFCFYENDESYEFSLKNIKGRHVGRQIIDVKETKAMNTLSDCHVLLINTELSDTLKRDLVDSLEGLQVVTISSINTNTTVAMISLRYVKSSIRFSVNQKLLKHTGVNLSSKVLRLAESVIQ